MTLKKDSIKTTDNLTRASFDVASFNETERTVDVVFATETLDVKRYDWNAGSMFIEQLVCSPEAVRMDRLNAGAPLLDNHDTYSGVRGVLGVVEKASLKNNEGRATVRFSKRADVEPIMNDVKDGILKAISVGYRVLKYEKQPVIDGETPVYRAIEWEPTEISLAVIPADYTSGVRNADSENKTREIEVIELPIENKKTNPIINKRAMEETPEQKIAREAAEKTNRTLILNEERTRVSEITESVRAAGLEPSFGITHVTEGTSADEVRKLVIAELGKKEKPTNGNISASVGLEAADKRIIGMEAAILHRANPKVFVMDDKSSEFRGLSLLDMARECLDATGHSTRGMSSREIATGAINGVRGSNSSSDFPIILGNAINRTLRKAYDLAPKTYEPFTYAATAKDFRPMTRVQLGDISAFKKVIEGGEYKYATMGESKEAYNVEKFGEIIMLTWESIVNDDLNAFSRIPRSIAEQAVQKQSDIVWGIVTGNPNMSDGVALFHANHGNLTASGTVINVANLGVARKVMRAQKSIGGSYLNLTPDFLIVAPELEDVANQYTSTNFVANESSKINNKNNTSLSVIVEPRLSAVNSGLSWYMASTPGRIDTIEYSFLEGEGELFTEQRRGFDVDGVETKVRMVFGAAPIDHRGLYKNPGA